MSKHSKNPRSFAGQVLIGKEETELVSLPRTTKPSSGRGCGGHAPQVRSGREEEALLGKGDLHFVPFLDTADGSLKQQGFPEGDYKKNKSFPEPNENKTRSNLRTRPKQHLQGQW